MGDYIRAQYLSQGPGEAAQEANSKHHRLKLLETINQKPTTRTPRTPALWYHGPPMRRFLSVAVTAAAAGELERGVAEIPHPPRLLICSAPLCYILCSTPLYCLLCSTPFF